ncbi:hypothetical protein [Euzebya sp.]|uniref:hypothetical protein n=1 Tax=Euzebya sp. TaxID=1971409 RepID=UPI0035152267
MTARRATAPQTSAASARMTLSEGVRQSLREARSAPSGSLSDAELQEVFGEAARYRFPAPDPEQMNEEIARGYLET